MENVVCFVNIYPLDSDLPGGECYPAFEQLNWDKTGIHVHVHVHEVKSFVIYLCTR